MRKPLRVVVLVVGVALGVPGWTQDAKVSPPPNDALSTAYAGIGDLTQQLAAGKLDSQQLVRDFVQRIETLDQAGPRVNAVLQLNPDASDIAAQRDRQSKAGDHGPLWGIPVLLKANIDTGDKMPTTPFAAEGQMIEPLVSVPIATVANPAATAAAEPELDPQAVRSST